jgi:hypothetical protein
MFPVITTTELTWCSLIFLAAKVTGSDGDTTGALLEKKKHLGKKISENKL